MAAGIVWALAEHFERVQRAAWRRKFGTEFTGWHEGRRIRFVWRECVVGHVCRGDDMGMHTECLQLVRSQWCWLRLKQ